MSRDALEHFVLPGVAALFLVCLLTPIAWKVAIRTGVLDKPSATKPHARPTPYLGGIAVAIGCFAAGMFVPGWSKGAYAVAAGAALVAVVGLLDDLHNLHPGPRVAAEAVAAAVAAAAGARVQLFGGPLDWIVTIVWIVVLTNSFNLLDNMDAAAGTVAAVTATGLAVAAALQDQVLVAGLASVVAGGCCGFLLFNRPPARIFMGDAGSLFLGYLLAVIALELRFPTSHRVDGVVAVLLLSGVALFDTTLVTLSRKRAGRRLLTGGTDHFSHRLKRLGAPAGLIAVFLGLLAGGACTLGIAIGRGSVHVGWAGAIAAAAAISLYRLLAIDVYGGRQPQAARADTLPLPRERPTPEARSPAGGRDPSRLGPGYGLPK